MNDEVVGFVAAMTVIGAAWRWLAALAAITFLTLDRLKPWPFDQVEAVSGGLGVMLDDIAVGLAVGLVLLLWDAMRRLAMGLGAGGRSAPDEALALREQTGRRCPPRARRRGTQEAKTS